MRLVIDLNEKLAQKAVFVNGIDKESMMAMEETAELAQAISKFNRQHSFINRDNLLKELADVLITTNMIFSYYGEDISELLPIAIEIKEAEINRKLGAE